VEIAEDEPEDVAVRRYMKAVMQSGVINKVRGPAAALRRALAAAAARGGGGRCAQPVARGARGAF
jgi:ribosomal protein S21